MGTVATSSVRYSTNLCLVFLICQSCDTDISILQDYCGDDRDGTFRVLTENIPCGTSESICSTAIKLYLGVHNTVACI